MTEAARRVSRAGADVVRRISAVGGEAVRRASTVTVIRVGRMSVGRRPDLPDLTDIPDIPDSTQVGLCVMYCVLGTLCYVHCKFV